jgi:hypothetical protein
MIKQIYDLVKKCSKEHKLVNSFKYDLLSKAAGVGEDPTPLVFLEMPLYFGNVNVQDGTVPCSFSIDIVLNPQSLENYDVEQLTDVSCQEIASQIAQQFIARMRNLYRDGESSVNIINYSILTLQRWYDDASYGVRLSIKASVVNEISFCSDDDYFDPNKEFNNEELLSSIDTDDASGCESLSLSWKLPTINFN